MNRIAPALALLLVIAGCARSEEASLVPPDSNLGYNQVGKLGSPEADDREPAIGQWRASLQENAQALEFGPMGTEPLLSLLCTGNRSVLLQRHGGAAAGPLPAMQIEVGEVSESFAVTAGGGTIPMLRAELPLNGQLASTLATSSQPLLVRLDDGSPMILPPSPLVANYLRSCTTAPPPAQVGNSALPIVGNGAAPPAPGNLAAPTAPANGAQPRP